MKFDLSLDKTTKKYLGMLREIGRSRFRPLGIEADIAGEPIPADHPFYKEIVGFGLGGGFYGASNEKGVGEKDSGEKGEPRERTRARRQTWTQDRTRHARPRHSRHRCIA